MFRYGFEAVRKISQIKLNEPNKLFGPTSKHFWYNYCGFNKYGLMRDDVLNETPIVLEALRRLPQKTVDERNFRIVRAGYLSLNKTILPKEEWTKLEDDVLYLTPIIKQVEKEWKEKEDWDKE